MKKMSIFAALLLVIALAMQAVLPVCGEGTEEPQAISAPEEQESLRGTAVEASAGTIDKAASGIDDICTAVIGESWSASEEQTTEDVSSFFNESLDMSPGTLDSSLAVGYAVQMGMASAGHLIGHVAGEEDSRGQRSTPTPNTNPKSATTPRPATTPKPTPKPTDRPAAPTPTSYPPKRYYGLDGLEEELYRLHTPAELIVVALP